MPTWGWFVVALVLIDTAVLVAWFLARKSPRKKKPTIAPRWKLAGLDATARDEIHRLVADNKKISAMELFRERTGAGLKDAKNVIDSVDRGNPLPTASTYIDTDGLDASAWEDIIPKLRSLKAEGRAITAIKLVRARTGLSLREAKEAVDRL